MSYWSHHPEKLDEIIFEEARARAEAGKILSTVEMIEEMYYEGEISIYYLLEERHGPSLAADIAIEAERDYWSGLTDYHYEQVKEAKYG